MTLVIKDALGTIINVGPWNDLGGTNPLPAGAVEDTVDQSVIDQMIAIADGLPTPATPQLNNRGLVRFSFTSTVDVKENIGVGPVTRVSKGRGRIYHIVPMTNDQYSVLYSVKDAAVKHIRTTARTAAYVEFRTTDQLFAAADVEEVTATIERVLTQ